MALNITQIDNVDPRVVYGGVWTRHPNQEAFNNTITLTRSIGNTATVMFTGNSIAVYGQLGRHPPDAPAITKYEIDDGDPVTFAPPSPASDLKRLLFFQSRAYPYGTHKLVMTNMVNLDWIWLDYFEVTNNGDPSASLTPNPTFTPNPSKSNKTSTGVIVGATLGGLAAGCLILGTILFFWWRRKKMARSRQMSSDDSESSYSPFRRSALMRDVEQSYPDGQMVQRASVITVPTPNSSSGFPTTASSETATAYPSFGVIPPAKMRDHLSSVTTPQGGDLPAYST